MNGNDAARERPIGTDLRVLEYGDEDELSDMELALEIGAVLQKAYPNHPWIVGFQGRGLVIRHLGIASEVARVIGREGFSTLLPREKLGTPKELRHSAMIFAGELLEAFGLPRSAWDGTPPVVPKSWTRRQQKDFT
jgi:hypothetical protein